MRVQRVVGNVASVVYSSLPAVVPRVSLPIEPKQNNAPSERRQAFVPPPVWWRALQPHSCLDRSAQGPVKRPHN